MNGSYFSHPFLSLSLCSFSVFLSLCSFSSEVQNIGSFIYSRRLRWKERKEKEELSWRGMYFIRKFISFLIQVVPVRKRREKTRSDVVLLSHPTNFLSISFSRICLSLSLSLSLVLQMSKIERRQKSTRDREKKEEAMEKESENGVRRNHSSSHFLVSFRILSNFLSLLSLVTTCRKQHFYFLFHLFFLSPYFSNSFESFPVRNSSFILFSVLPFSLSLSLSLSLSFNFLSLSFNFLSPFPIFSRFNFDAWQVLELRIGRSASTFLHPHTLNLTLAPSPSLLVLFLKFCNFVVLRKNLFISASFLLLTHFLLFSQSWIERKEKVSWKK